MSASDGFSTAQKTRTVSLPSCANPIAKSWLKELIPPCLGPQAVLSNTMFSGSLGEGIRCKLQISARERAGSCLWLIPEMSVSWQDRSDHPI